MGPSALCILLATTFCFFLEKPVVAQNATTADPGNSTTVAPPSCGACNVSPGSTEPPCMRNVTYTCPLSVEKYETKVRNCYAWFGCWYTTVTKYRQRYGPCQKTARFCCANADLTPDGQLCINNCRGPWAAWQEWSTCSRPCGGCGVQTRTRYCPGHWFRRSEKENKACNEKACETSNCQISFYCGSWFFYCKKPCESCCMGWKLDPTTNSTCTKP